MGISIDRALDLRDRVKGRVLDTFSLARSCKSSHAELVNMMGERVYDSNEYRKLPRWAKGWIDGFTSAQFERMYDLLEWRVFWRGALVRSEDVQDGTWSECETDKGKHVYKSDPSRVY